jgi:two-component system, OmpR family, sensor histidine kinase MprB
MSFRNRLTLAAALAVAVAIALASGTIYLAARRELRSQVDQALLSRVEQLTDGVGELRNPHPDRPVLGGAGGYTQVIASDGSAIRFEEESIVIPVTQRAKKVAGGSSGPYFSDMQISGHRVRVVTTPLLFGTALQVARPLDEVDLVLKRLGLLLVVIAAGGIALAAALGRIVARAALVPVHRLTEGAERVAETRSLAHRIEPTGSDELGRLARSFNSMLEALDESVKSQRQLVADASHELRTPLTSLRTNIEVLARADQLPNAEREELLRDLTNQIAELSGLVTDLIDLARDDEPDIGVEEIRLDRLVESAVKRVKSHWPRADFVADLKPTLVRGATSRLDRAIANLLDNAAKWSPPGGKVEVKVASGEVTVRDHGPGIDEADLPHIFDRFYRASSARALPGSGLGLAIVRRVAESHGGTVTAEAAGGGGTLIRLRLPALPFSPGQPEESPVPSGAGRMGEEREGLEGNQLAPG